jgi:hypothetical protein
VTHPVEHLDDDLLSALVDDQLTPEERSLVQAHLGTCSACQARLDEFRSVAGLLRRLPDVEPTRDFALGLRVLVDPPNVIRLRRWYAVARASAASLAAVFVLLSVGTLYVDYRPKPSNEIAALSKPQAVTVPAAAQNAQTSPTSAPAARVAAPAAAPAASPAAAGAAAGANPEPLDQQAAAATSQMPLPTPVPVPPPTAIAPPVVTAFANASVDPAAPLQTAAIVVGVLALLSIVATLVVRRRLQHPAPHL